MKFWLVHVRCVQEPDARGIPPMCYEDCIVEAEDSASAMQIGRDFIACDAPLDIRWAEFEALSASSIKLPVHI